MKPGNILVVTNLESFEDDNDKCADRVRAAVTTCLGYEGVLVKHVMAFEDRIPAEDRPGRILESAQKEGCQTIVIYRDNAGQEKLATALRLLIQAGGHPLKLLHRVGGSYDFALAA